MENTFCGRALAVRELERFMVVVAVREPSDEEWDHRLRMVEPSEKNALVLTSIAPNAAQRARLHTAEGENPRLKAIVATTREARRAAIAARWFNPRLRFFSAPELDAALDYIGAVGDERALLRRTLEELHGQLIGQGRPAPIGDAKKQTTLRAVGR